MQQFFFSLYILSAVDHILFYINEKKFNMHYCLKQILNNLGKMLNAVLCSVFPYMEKIQKIEKSCFFDFQNSILGKCVQKNFNQLCTSESNYCDFMNFTKKS